MGVEDCGNLTTKGTILDPRIQDTGQDTEHQIQDTTYNSKIQDTGHMPQKIGHRILDTENRTKNTGYRTRHHCKKKKNSTKSMGRLCLPLCPAPFPGYADT